MIYKLFIIFCDKSVIPTKSLYWVNFTISNSNKQENEEKQLWNCSQSQLLPCKTPATQQTGDGRIRLDQRCETLKIIRARDQNIRGSWTCVLPTETALQWSWLSREISSHLTNSRVKSIQVTLSAMSYSSNFPSRKWPLIHKIIVKSQTIWYFLHFQVHQFQSSTSHIPGLC